MTSPRFYHLSTSLNGSLLRRETLSGVEYIVVPCVSKLGDNVEWPINSKTPEFIPASVLSLATENRNNRPVVMGHPQDDAGNYISANDPQVLAKYAYGFMFGAKFTDDLRVCVDIWLDPERAKIVGKDAERVIERLLAGETVEVSEGDYVLSEIEEGTWNGKKYGAKWIACWSDHLATLREDEIGACSIEDGCGALRASQGVESKLSVAVSLNSKSPGLDGPPGSPGSPAVGVAAPTLEDDPSRASSAGGELTQADSITVSMLAQARRPTFSGTETSPWSKPTFADYIRYLYNGDEPPTSVGKCSSDLKRSIAAHSLLGDASANNFSDLTFYPVVNPSTGHLNERALRDVLAGKGSSSLSDSALSSAQDMATRLLNSEFSSNLPVPDKKVEVSSFMDKKKESLFRRMISSMGEMLKSSMSNNDLRWKLYKAIKEVDAGISFVHDEDVAAGTVLYCVIIRVGGDYWEDGESEYHNYQRTFSIDDNQQVTINDDRVEVEWYQGWKPLAEATPAPAVEISASTEENLAASGASVSKCGCQKEGGKVTMNRKEVISRLSASGGPFAGNAAALEAMNDAGIQALDSAYPATTLASAPTVPAEAPVLPTTAPTTPPTPAVASPVVSLSQADYAAMKAASDAYTSQQAAVKSALVTSLVSAQKEFTEVELQAMEVSSLEKLARVSGVVSCGGGSGNASYLGLPVPANSAKPALRELPDPLGLKVHGLRPDGLKLTDTTN